VTTKCRTNVAKFHFAIKVTLWKSLKCQGILLFYIVSLVITFQISKYFGLSITEEMRINIAIVQVLQKYRISAHSPEIESGRYRNITQNKRKCIKCNSGQIEDEVHFFMHCPIYNTHEQELCLKLKNINFNP
jgi:hypothetical protein